MKISLDWLREYVAVDLPRQEILDKLTMIGLVADTTEERDGDLVLDLETYANRPDTLGHLGVAREMAALLGLPLIEKDWPLAELPEATTDIADVQIVAEALCPRYCGIVVRNVPVGPSPEWLTRRIEAMGLRPVNNVVDVSNYVLFATAQPIHTFDFGRIGGGRIVVRKAKRGETLVDLDGRTLALAADMLVIADESRPVALAGVIGGQASGITESTRDVFIESANFDPVGIRKTAKALGLSTDASYRFERGADIGFAPQAALMAASLLTRMGGRASRGLIDRYPRPPKATTVRLRLRRIAELLGVEVPETLRRRGPRAARVPRRGRAEGPLAGGSAHVPRGRLEGSGPRRGDRPVLRLRPHPLGGHARRLVRPGRQPEAGAPGPDPRDPGRPGPRRGHQLELRRPGEGSGGRRAGGRPSRSRTPSPTGPRSCARPSSPASSRTPPGTSTGELEGVHIFELGNVYYWGDDEKHREDLHLGLLSTGLLPGAGFAAPAAATDFYVLKGAVEAALEALRFDPAGFEERDHPSYEPGRALAVLYRGQEVGRLGLLRRDLAASASVDGPVYAAEIDLSALFEKTPRAFEYVPVPKLPGVVRDLSFLMDRSVSYGEIARVLGRLDQPLLEGFELVDRFSGAPLPADKVSLTIRLRFRHPQRTLVAGEVDRAEQEIVGHLRSALAIQLREGKN